MRRRPNSVVHNPLLIAIMFALSAVIIGCAGNGNGNSSDQASSDSADDLPDVYIPTEAEAETAAAEEITAENADEEFDRLQREIDAELDDNG